MGRTLRPQRLNRNVTFACPDERVKRTGTEATIRNNIRQGDMFS